MLTPYIVLRILPVVIKRLVVKLIPPNAEQLLSPAQLVLPHIISIQQKQVPSSLRKMLTVALPRRHALAQLKAQHAWPATRRK
jgi:hypothetical protein